VDVDLEELTAAGEENYTRSLTSSVEREVGEPDYDKRVPVAQDVESGEIVWLELDDTTRIGAFGQSGSGKTTLAKRLILCAVIYGDWKAIHGSDVKNDFRTVNRKGGASKKLQKETEGLLRGEEAQREERIMAIPNFMVPHYSSRPQYGTIFSLQLSDLTESEFKFVAGYHDWDSTASKETLDEILLNEDLEKSSLDRLMAIAEQRDDQNTLLRKLKGVKNNRLLSQRVDHNMRDVLLQLDEDKNVLSLGMKGWRNFLNGQEHFFQFYAGKLLRSFKDLTDNGDLTGKYIYFMDEAHKLMPQGKESIVKEEFQDFYDLSGRQRDVIPFISTQRPNQVPNPTNKDDLDFVSDLSDVFLMRGKTPLHESQWKPIVSNMGVYNKDGHAQLKRWQSKIQSLNRYEGIYISSEKHSGPGDCPKIRTLSPVVAHPG
jgi:hypothetical protein